MANFIRSNYDVSKTQTRVVGKSIDVDISDYVKGISYNPTINKELGSVLNGRNPNHFAVGKSQVSGTLTMVDGGLDLLHKESPTKDLFDLGIFEDLAIEVKYLDYNKNAVAHTFNNLHFIDISRSYDEGTLLNSQSLGFISSVPVKEYRVA